MKYSIYHVLSGILLILMITSCSNDFLDRYPKDSPNPENFFIDANSARSALNAVYNPWTRSANMYERDLVIMLDAMSDDSYWRPSRAASIQQSDWDITPTHSTITDYWRYVYRSINAANFAIEGIPTSNDESFTEEDQLPYIAEARFMRAFDYLFLVSLFGDVPLITHTLKGFDQFNQPRTDKDSIYEQILADFKFAKENLPGKQPDDATGAPTKATAAAYLAKAFLYKKDFPKAEVAAREAIQIALANGYQLIDDYLSIWDENNEGNPELLFYIQYVNDNPDYGQNMTIQRIVRGCPPEFKS